MNKRVGLVVTLVSVAVVVAAIPIAWRLGAFESVLSAAADPTPVVTSPPPVAATTRVAPAPAPVKPQPLLHAAPVSVNTTGFWSWSVLDRNTGAQTGSANADRTNVTASMIKAWLAADYLRRKAEKNAKPSAHDLSELTIMIRDSDNDAATYFADLDGYKASIGRLVSLCGLTDSKPGIDWAHTLVSARDATRMGACIGDGRAAGPKYTDYLLNEMRSVRGVGRFGIINVLPADVAKQTAIKNGWVIKTDGDWHVNCMAVGPDWVLSVMTVYPSSKGMNQGISTCESVAKQLMAAVPSPASS
jgi:hypothetical protein